MNLVDYIQNNAPITNLPDLLGLHHNNFLGLPMIAQLIIIFVLVEVMEFFNHQIRYKDKQQYYPVVWSLLAVSLCFIFYYCFQTGFPESALFDSTGKEKVAVIGWFCLPAIVGWPWAIANIIITSHVIYCLLSACLQTVAQISVKANFIENKPWKQWHVGTGIMLVGILVTLLIAGSDAVAASWSLFFLHIVILLFVVWKVCRDTRYFHNFKYALLIGVTYLVCIEAITMLSLECLRGGVYFIIILAALLFQAKARKKKGERIGE